jgi:hypothetical protein
LQSIAAAVAWLWWNRLAADSEESYFDDNPD